MNATMDRTKDDVSSVVDQEYRTRTTAKSVQSKKRTEMDVQRSSIWAAVKRIYFTNEKSTDLKRDNSEHFVSKSLELSIICTTKLPFNHINCNCPAQCHSELAAKACFILIVCAKAISLDDLRSKLDQAIPSRGSCFALWNYSTKRFFIKAASN